MNKPQKTLKGYALAISAALILFCIVIIIIVFMSILSSPKFQLTKAFHKTFSDISLPLPDMLGIPELKAGIGVQPYQQKLHMNLDDISIYRDVLTLAPSLSLENHLDYTDSKSDTDIALQLGGSKVLSASLYAQSDALSLSLPNLYDSAFEVDTLSFGKDFNASVLSDIWNFSANDQLGFKLFQKDLNSESFANLYLKYYPEDFKALLSQMSMQLTETTVQNIEGTEYTGKVYRIDLPKAVYECNLKNAVMLSENLSGFSLFNSKQLDSLISSFSSESLSAMVTIDKKSGRIIKIEHDAGNLAMKWIQPSSENSRIALSLTVPDAQTQIQHTLEINTKTEAFITEQSGKYSILEASEQSELAWNTSFNETDYSLSGASSFAVNADQYCSVDFKSTFSDVVWGKSFTLAVEECNLALNDGDMEMNLSGEYNLSPMNEGEAVLPPGKSVKPLFMNRDDLYGIGFTILKNAAKTTFGSLLTYF